MAERSKTPKELAEVAASAALESLRAALASEVTQRDRVRSLRSDAAVDRSWLMTLESAEKDLNGYVARSNAAFKAWREASEAVPP